jgi:phenylalanine-4-hydroxylase
MRQHYERYTAEHQQVWNLLFSRQAGNLHRKAAPEYLHQLGAMEAVLDAKRIVDFSQLDEALYAATGWKIHVVPGLIPASDFLAFLADRKFCSSTWLRSLQQLDYLEEPDMFHDIFGHIPLLMDAGYAAFMQRLGVLGRQYAGNEKAVALLERYYWFTIEFGLIRESADTRIYGAGILSSFGESNSIYRPETVIRPFCLKQILQHDFIKSNMQQEYFEIASFRQLYDSLDEVASILADECIIVRKTIAAIEPSVPEPK